MDEIYDLYDILKIYYMKFQGRSMDEFKDVERIRIYDIN